MAGTLLRSLPAVTQAPADFKVPNAAEWVLQVVSASFDGTGAGGSFLPAVQILGPGGDVTATFADKNVSVSAGSSCEVTFGPFLRSPSASGGGGITSITSTDGSVTVTNPGGPTTDLSVITSHTAYEQSTANNITIANGSSDSLVWSHGNGSTFWDYTVTNAPLTKAAGIYALVANVSVTTAFTAGGYAVAAFSMGDGGVSSQVRYAVIDNKAAVGGIVYGMTNTHYMSTSARWSISIENHDGSASRTFFGNSYAVKIT